MILVPTAAASRAWNLIVALGAVVVLAMCSPVNADYVGSVQKEDVTHIYTPRIHSMQGRSV